MLVNQPINGLPSLPPQLPGVAPASTPVASRPGFHADSCSACPIASHPRDRARSGGRDRPRSGGGPGGGPGGRAGGRGLACGIGGEVGARGVFIGGNSRTNAFPDCSIH